MGIDFRLMITISSKKSLTMTRKLTFAVLASVMLAACQKEATPPQAEIVQSNLTSQLPAKSNPLSLRNIIQAKKKIQNSFENSQNSRYDFSQIPVEQQLLYLRINPNNITTEIIEQLESDTTVQILDFPFANAAIYGEGYAFDESKRELLKDGFLYVVLPRQNTIFSRHGISTTILDTLYQPLYDEDPLVIQSLVDGGYISQQQADQKICFRRPEGFVRYTDQQLGANQPVIGIQVWAIAFGVKIHTYTDANGYFRIGWKFLFGTIIGTHAKNNRVNVKPLNTQGSWWLTIPMQFIVGSVHVDGWVGSCSINSININFNTHLQNRYWAHLLNATAFHDQFSSNDIISAAPRGIVIYAHWDDNYGISSAPMLRTMVSANSILINAVLGGIFGVNILNPTYQSLYNVLRGYLPDITIKTGNWERQFFSAQLMQTAFHELGHGSHYVRAGIGYWVDFIWATLFPTGGCGGYGCGTGTDDGNVAVAESWAEFIGTNHALRRYPNGEKQSIFFGNNLVRFDFALEQEMWFFNNWIPTGVYNDLIDVNNTDPFENIWDRTGGLTIQQLYQAFGPDIDFPCDYESEILRLYPFLNINDVNDIFIRHGVACL